VGQSKLRKEMFHFGTTGYLDSEQDIRLKEAAIAAINRYTIPLSKSYISSALQSTRAKKNRINVYTTHYNKEQYIRTFSCYPDIDKR
jgi:hypothetical protein